jgi:Na+-driven multidrug efflux pump
VAIGAGWQAIVAYVNIACYYLFGVPLGLIMGYKLDMGVKVSLFSLPLFYFILFHFSYEENKKKKKENEMATTRGIGLMLRGLLPLWLCEGECLGLCFHGEQC